MGQGDLQVLVGPLASKNLHGRPGHRDVSVLRGPLELQAAAGKVGQDAALCAIGQNASDAHCRGARAACLRLPAAPFPGAHRDLRRCTNLNEVDVHAIRKHRVVLEGRADRIERHAVDVPAEEHGVRVAHRNAVDGEPVPEPAAKPPVPRSPLTKLLGDDLGHRIKPGARAPGEDNAATRLAHAGTP